MADKLCQPSSLSSLQKSDWSKAERPILAAVREICEQEGVSGACWRKKLVCVVWLKLLCKEAGEDVETAWRENPFFPLQNALPDVNHVVLLELVKSMSASKIFAQLLLCLPPSQICYELERLTQHVKTNPTSEDDVRLFLELLWELWKGRDERTLVEGEESIETMFANQFTRLTTKPPSTSPQAAKRFKLDTSASAPNTDILYILLHALRDMRDHISTTDLCLRALAISLDVLYTSFLTERAVALSTEEKMHILSKAVVVREKNNEKLSLELIREVQRDLTASHAASQFQPSQMNLTEALKIVTELGQFWQKGGFLEMREDSEPSYSAFKLQQSVQRVLTALEEADVPEKNVLRGLLESLTFPAIESSPEVDAKVTTTIISHRLDDYRDFSVLFAGERSWANVNEEWMDCLEKNQAAFRQLDTLIELSSTLTCKLHSEGSSVTQCRKLMKVVADIFSSLSLEDKNKALGAILKLSSKGFFERSVPSVVTNGFEQELNMAFNCIIQGGAGAAQQGNLSTAVSLVARVAFQNPEATLRSCCHSAIFNKGAFALMAKILQQLPGLRGQRRRRGHDEGGDRSGGGLLCWCLQEVVRTRSLSGNEKEQFLKFLGLLMMPVMTTEGEENRFLSPQEVVNTFVLPNLSLGTCPLML